MKAGRELDALIAEKVMDWKWLNMPGLRQPIMCPPEQWGAYIPERVKVMELEVCDLDPPDRLPHYSTDIVASWLVVEKLRSDGLGIIFNDTMGQYRGRFWRYDRSDGWDIDAWILCPDTQFTVWEETAPLVICLAALKAVGVEAGA